MYLPILKPLGMFVGKVPQDLCTNIQSTNTSNAARTLADDLPELLVQYFEHLKSCRRCSDSPGNSFYMLQARAEQCSKCCWA